MWYILLCIPKYILTFAAVLLTLNTTLMKYFVRCVYANGDALSFVTCSPNLYDFMRSLEKCTYKSFTVSLHEPEQKGGQYEQQPE